MDDSTLDMDNNNVKGKKWTYNNGKGQKTNATDLQGTMVMYHRWEVLMKKERCRAVENNVSRTIV